MHRRRTRNCRMRKRHRIERRAHNASHFYKAVHSAPRAQVSGAKHMQLCIRERLANAHRERRAIRIKPRSHNRRRVACQRICIEDIFEQIGKSILIRVRKFTANFQVRKVRRKIQEAKSACAVICSATVVRESVKVFIEVSRTPCGAEQSSAKVRNNSRDVHTRPTTSTFSNFSVFDSIDCVMYGLRNLRPNSDGATHDAYVKSAMSRQVLNKALSPDGNPRLRTFQSVLASLGLRMSLKPAVGR